MVVIPEPRKVKIELWDTEVKQIIEELERVPYSIYTFCMYGNLITKLRKALERSPAELQEKQ